MSATARPDRRPASRVDSWHAKPLDSIATIHTIDPGARSGEPPARDTARPGTSSEHRERTMVRTELAVEALAALEETATVLSVPHLTPAEIALARAMNIEMAECAHAGNVERYGVLGHEFHELLYSRCPNTHLLDLVRMHAAEIRAVAEVHPVFCKESALLSIHEHDELLDALERRAISPQEIAVCARAHRLRTVRTVLDDLMSNLDELLAGDFDQFVAQ